MSAEQLIGNWKLVSWQVVTGDEAKDLFGTKPKGYMILTREGRAMTVTTAEARAPGESEAERFDGLEVDHQLYLHRVLHR
jgi:Lipocalin-like domain